MFKDWLKAAGIRALRTIAQTAIATIGVGSLISEVDWLAVGSAALLAGILSLLTSIAGLPELELADKLAAKEEEKEIAENSNEGDER